MPAADLLGYADKLSVEPGETIAFMVSTGQERYQAEIVRFTGGPPRAGEAGVTGPALTCDDYPGRAQPIPLGSYVLVPGGDALRLGGGFTIQAWICPTLPARGHEQGIVAKWSPGDQAGFALLLDGDGRLALQVGDGAGNVCRVTATTALRAGQWVFVVASYGDGVARLEWREQPRSWLAGASDIAELACDTPMTDATERSPRDRRARPAIRRAGKATRHGPLQRQDRAPAPLEPSPATGRDRRPRR